MRYGRLIFQSTAYVPAPVSGQKGWISHLHSGHALDKSPRNVNLPSGRRYRCNCNRSRHSRHLDFITNLKHGLFTYRQINIRAVAMYICYLVKYVCFNASFQRLHWDLCNCRRSKLHGDRVAGHRTPSYVSRTSVRHVVMTSFSWKKREKKEEKDLRRSKGDRKF